MPVVNEKNILQGLITLDDLLELIAAEMTDLATLVSREQKQEHEKRP
jgi:Mg2+/Co2+ transporter CorB